MTNLSEVELIDPFGVPDVFCDKGLISVVNVGGSCYRFTLASGCGGEPTAAARVVMPIELIVPAIYLTAKEIGWRFIPVGMGRRELVLH